MSRGGARGVWAAGVGLAALMGTPVAYANTCDCSRIVAQCNAVFNVDSKPQSTTFAGDGASAQTSYQTTIYARFRPNASGTMHGAYVDSACLKYEIVYGYGRVLMAGTLTNGARNVTRSVFTADELDAASLRTSTCGVCFDEDTERLKDQVDERFAAEQGEAEAAARRQELEDYYLTEDVSHLSTEELEALQRDYPTLRADEAQRLRDEQQGGSGSCWDGLAIDGPCLDDDSAEIDPFLEVGNGDLPQPTDPDDGDGNGWAPGDGAAGPGQDGNHDPYPDLGHDPYSGANAGLPAFPGDDPSEPSPYDDGALSAFMQKASGGADLQALSNDVRARLDDYEDDDYARQRDAADRLASAQELASSRAETKIGRIENSAAMARPDLLGGYPNAGGYPSAGYPTGAPSVGGGSINEADEQAKCKAASQPYIARAQSVRARGPNPADINRAQQEKRQIISQGLQACLRVIRPDSRAASDVRAQLRAIGANVQTQWQPTQGSSPAYTRPSATAPSRQKRPSRSRLCDWDDPNGGGCLDDKPTRRPPPAPTRSSSGCGPGITGVAC